MRVGDLVKYIPKPPPWRGSGRLGMIIEVYKEDDPGIVLRSPYRVRWFDHSPTIRTWYIEEELEILSESR
jgi:hypothetical protein